jgi:8-oxo-dGTP pyrophosphatase MutT (NUDIX family)
MTGSGCQFPDSNQVYGVILVSSRERILLVRGRKTGKWSFPKGHRELRESAYECALRELREETGIRLIHAPIIGPCRLSAGSYYVFHSPCEYIAHPLDYTEVADARWFTLNEMATIPSNIDVSEYLRRNNVKLLPTRNMYHRCQMPTTRLLSNSV